MKIICSKSSLLKSVSIALKAVPSKTTMPILECILMDATTNQIKFTTNDMELGIETIVEGTIEEKGRVALDAKIFYEIIRRLPDNDITIKTDEKYTATITCEKAKFNIPGKSGEDFAYLPLIEKEESLTISQFTLKEMIRQTIFSIASNETNKLMTGELFEIKNNYLKIVSLDGHRIAIRRMELKKDYTIVMVTHNMQQAVRISDNTAFFLLGEVIYRTLITGVNSVVFMGVYFALFGLLLSIGLFVVAKISDLEITSNKILLVGGCVLLLLILGILFEFIYELDFSSVRTVADNYVFAIDNSGSMQDNDPNQERVAAIKQLLSNRDEDVEFAVYTFSEDIRCIREMMPVSAGIEDFTTEPNGGTPIVGVLGKIMDDMESGALPYDEGTQVILLTDGYATDNGFFDFRLNKILKKYNSKKVSVSTVGLGSVDENMLNDISGKTGGISVRTDNVDELATAMASAVRVTDTSRNLLSARARTNYNWAYALMRIVFLIILGAGFLGIKLLAVDNTANLGMILISSLIGIVLGALIMDEFFARLLMTLLFGMMITTLEKTIVETASGNIGVRFM